MPQTLNIEFTKADSSNVSGGVILRRMDDGMYVAHNFVRELGSSKPISFYWGRYTPNLQEARQGYRAKLTAAHHLIISAEEIAKELES